MHSMVIRVRDITVCRIFLMCFLFFLQKDNHTLVLTRKTFLERISAMDNPFIDIYQRELAKRRLGDERWDFYYVSKNMSYEEDGERIRVGMKLNCKCVPRLYCCVASDVWEMKGNIVVIKDIGIDETRTRKGYFTQFVAYLLTLYGVVSLESVQPKWFNDYLSLSTSKWIRQGGPWVNNFILTV
jgi:hypothetical protein